MMEVTRFLQVLFKAWLIFWRPLRCASPMKLDFITASPAECLYGAWLVFALTGRVSRWSLTLNSLNSEPSCFVPHLCVLTALKDWLSSPVPLHLQTSSLWLARSLLLTLNYKRTSVISDVAVVAVIVHPFLDVPQTHWSAVWISDSEKKTLF